MVMQTSIFSFIISKKLDIKFFFKTQNFQFLLEFFDSHKKFDEQNLINQTLFQYGITEFSGVILKGAGRIKKPDGY